MVPPPVPPPRKTQWGLVVVVCLALIIIGIVATAFVASLIRPSMTQAEIETRYMDEVSDLVADFGRSVDRVTRALQNWVPLTNDDTTRAAVLAERRVISEIRNSLDGLIVPCSGYQGMHTRLRSAMTDTMQALDLIAEALVFPYDPGKVNQAVALLEDAQTSLESATADSDRLEATIPNC